MKIRPATELPTIERLHELFILDPEGTLRRKVRTANSTRVGELAGSLHTPTGYWCVHVDGMQLKLHRVIFALHHGRWPDAELDHIDGNLSNNRLHNLREADRFINNKNSRKRKDSTSGVTGVNWRIRHKKWEARISVNNNRIFLGRFDSFEEAVLARIKAETRYGTFTDRHGATK